MKNNIGKLALILALTGSLATACNSDNQSNNDSDSITTEPSTSETQSMGTIQTDSMSTDTIGDAIPSGSQGGSTTLDTNRNSPQ